jgi:uncharacterized membrane protein YccC
MINTEVSLRKQQAFKIAFGCLLCVIINHLLHLPEMLSFFSSMSVFVLFGIFSLDVVGKAIERLLGILCCSIFAVLLVKLFSEYLFFYWLFACLFMYAAGALLRKKHTYIFLAAAIIGSALLISGAAEPDKILFLAKDFLQQLLIAVVIVILLEKLIPVYAEKHFYHALKTAFQNLADYTLRVKEGNGAQYSVDYHQELKGLWNYLLGVKKNASIDHEKCQAQIQLLKLTKRRLSHLSRLLKRFSASDLYPEYREEIDVILLAIEKSIRSETKEKGDLSLLLDGLAKHLAQDRVTARFIDSDYKEFLQLISIEALLQKIGKGLLETISQSAPVEPELPISTKKTPLNHVLGLRFLSVMLMIIAAKYLFHWGALIQTSIAAVIVSFQANVGKSYCRFKQRTYGIFLGLVVSAGVLLVLSFFPHLALSLILFFLALLVLAYYALGDEKTKYISLQAGLLLTLVLGGAMIIDPATIHIALNRLLGVFQGSLIGFAAVLLFSPKHPLKELSIAVSQYVQDCSKAMSSSFSPDLTKELTEQLSHIQALAHDAEIILLFRHAKKEKVSSLLHCLEELEMHLHSLLLAYPKIKAINCEWVNGFDLLHAYMKGNSSSDQFLLAINHLEQKLEAELAEIRSSGVTHQLTAEELSNYAAMVQAQSEVLLALQEMAGLHIGKRSLLKDYS